MKSYRNKARENGFIFHGDVLWQSIARHWEIIVDHVSDAIGGNVCEPWHDKTRIFDVSVKLIKCASGQYFVLYNTWQKMLRIAAANCLAVTLLKE